MTDIRADFPRGRSRRLDRIEFRLLVAFTYPLFLVAAALKRLLGYPGEGGARAVSVFAQARADVEASIALAFMG